jgi:hypothetical protein
MIIDLIDNNTSLPVPRVSFDPPGRFTPNLMSHFLPYFASEIDRAQTAVRHAARVRPAVAPSKSDAGLPALKGARK